MTMQRRPNNPIELRKQAVRKHTRNAALFVGGGLGGGLALGLLLTSWSWIVLGLIVAVAGGFYHWNKVQKIVNHRDNY